MKNIKAIVFDAYGTLFDVNSAAEKCKDKIGSKMLKNNTLSLIRNTLILKCEKKI